MSQVHRILDARPVTTLAAYERTGGGRAVEAARASEPGGIIDVVAAAGLRGRGGAGFPTGRKWGTVVEEAQGRTVTVVVNAAEGEPGTLKDRTLLRRNPYQVLEGALIAAHVAGADHVIVGMKRSAGSERSRVDAAITELDEAGWSKGIEVECVAGSDRYLLGEETALLEVLDGRPPFPRVAPPYRDGVDDGHPVTLVNNVETLANVPAIVLDGPEAFRAMGTRESPGTIVCTVSGCTPRAGVGEFELGTPLAEVLERLGGISPRDVVAVLSGTANPILTGDALDAPLSWEGLASVGGGLGCAGFIVIDDEADIVAVAHGVSHFLSVESCGQCTPCKQDGLAITALLDRARTSAPDPEDGRVALSVLAARVTDGARCFLAQQHQNVVESLLAHFPDALAAHVDGRADAADPFPIVPLDDIVDGQPVLAVDELDLAPDWGDGTTDSPSDRIDVRARWRRGYRRRMSVAAVVLAAGAGTRFAASGGAGHKLFAELDGRTVLARVLDAVLEAGLDDVALVAGAVDLRAHVPAAVTLLPNDRWAEGIATSLHEGVRWAATAGHDAVVVGLADQPAVTSATWAALAQCPPAPPIAVATYDGRRGNPVRLAAAVWTLLPATGDEGARALMRGRPELVREVPCSGQAWDVDTVEDLERWS